jgi:putative Ca2+/H+ antiporter (TMEM165/GDT1 family)
VVDLPALGVAFIVMAAWALVPDKKQESVGKWSAGGIFLTTLIAFFLVEIGDKTQIATSLLAAQFPSRSSPSARPLA